MKYNYLHDLKNSNKYYAFSNLVNLLAIGLFVSWTILDKSLPQADGANYLDLSFQKINSWDENSGVLSFLRSIYFLRDWKPIFFPNFFTFIAMLSHELQFILDFYAILTFVFMQIILYIIMNKLVDPLIASLSASFITLNPYFFNIANQVYADYISVIFIIFSIYLYYVFLKRNVKFSWTSSVIFAFLAVITRPVESLLYLLVLILIMTVFFRNRLNISAFKSLKLSDYFFVAFNLLSLYFALFILKSTFWLGLEFGLNIETFWFLTVIVLLISSIKFSKFVDNSLNLITKYFMQLFVLSLLWFAPFLTQTWNWIYYTSIGNRVFRSDRSFVDSNPLDVLFSIVDSYFPSNVLFFLIVVAPILLAISFYKSKNQSFNLTIVYLFILLSLVFFGIIYIYSGTGDSRRVMLLFILILLYFIYFMYCLIGRGVTMVFLSLFLVLYSINVLNSIFQNNLNIASNVIKINQVNKPFTLSDPNIEAYDVISNFDIPASSKVAWLTSNSARTSDKSYVLDPATIRMLFTINNKSTFFWYTVSPDLETYRSDLRSIGYSFVLVDVSLPLIEPPLSNYFMNSNFKIIKEMNIANSIPSGFEFVKSLQLNNNEVLLLKVV